MVLNDLLSSIHRCEICKDALAHAPRPVLAAAKESKIAIIGQAPGLKVHQSGIPWDDASGERLRDWLGVSKEIFYDKAHFAIIPMGFCYPGKGKSGDLPPRKECAPQWHSALFERLSSIKLKILIGQYAQSYYLGNKQKSTLTETLQNFEDYLPEAFVLPHPSPRNNIWLKKNPWMEAEVIPELKKMVRKIIN